ncbi:unnamed protein product [Parajaminaea phylloscopi]
MTDPGSPAGASDSDPDFVPADASAGEEDAVSVGEVAEDVSAGEEVAEDDEDDEDAQAEDATLAVASTTSSRRRTSVTSAGGNVILTRTAVIAPSRQVNLPVVPRMNLDDVAAGVVLKTRRATKFLKLTAIPDWNKDKEHEYLRVKFPCYHCARQGQACLYSHPGDSICARCQDKGKTHCNANLRMPAWGSGGTPSVNDMAKGIAYKRELAILNECDPDEIADKKTWVPPNPDVPKGKWQPYLQLAQAELNRRATADVVAGIIDENSDAYKLYKKYVDLGFVANTDYHLKKDGEFPFKDAYTAAMFWRLKHELQESQDRVIIALKQHERFKDVFGSASGSAGRRGSAAAAGPSRPSSSTRISGLPSSSRDRGAIAGPSSSRNQGAAAGPSSSRNQGPIVGPARSSKGPTEATAGSKRKRSSDPKGKGRAIDPKGKGRLLDLEAIEADDSDEFTKTDDEADETDDEAININ